MNTYEERVLVFRELPTGKEIASAIKDEGLDDWVLVEVDKKYNETNHPMVVDRHKYRYEVRFRR